MHDLVVRDLEQARNRTLGLTDLDDPTLVTLHDLLMSPLMWDLAHIGQQEELWLLRTADPARRAMLLRPEVDALYDAFKHPAPSARRCRCAGMAVQHEEQHDETMLATLQLVRPPSSGGAPAAAARPRCGAGSRFRRRRVVHAWRGRVE
jgi:gamma-glutamyl hercynylcysteine S-oxide synthase